MPLLTPDRNEIDECWSLLPHPEGTVTRVFARNRETGALDGDFARNAGEMFHFASVNVDKQVYVCPNPCRRGAVGVRHTAKDVTHWSYLLIDMDPIEDQHDAAHALEDALNIAGEWWKRSFKGTLRPFIIDSGRGRQAWIRLDDVPLTDDKVRNAARKVNGYWLSRLTEHLGMCCGCKVDTSTSDLPRPMRMPGTFNQKTGRMAKIIEPSEHIFGGLAHQLTVMTPEARLIDPPVVPIAPGLPWQMAMHRLTLSAKKYLKKGQEEPGRHKVMFHTARKLHELGVSREQARKAIRQANRLKGPDQELTDGEIEHALDTGFSASQT